MGLRFQVLFHSPHRGSFHLSLTVLLLYRSYLVFSLGSWSTQIPTGFLVSRRTQVPSTEPAAFRIRGFHPLWQAFPSLSAMLPVYNSAPYGTTALQPRLIDGLGSSNFARRYFRNHYYFLLPGYLDGSVPPVSLPHTMYSYADNRLAPVGLPHSAIDGSKDVCSFPSLFAAYHGLLRLNTPRHPP